VVHDGGLLIFPTDTVYGIGCDPMRLDAVERIYRSKHRPRGRPLSLCLPTVAELLEYVDGNALATMAARRFLPGPLTIIVERPAFIDMRVSAGLPTLGLRVPNHAVCTAILERCGPLASTSANLSGEQAYLGDRGDSTAAGEFPDADLLIESGPTPCGRESTVIDLSDRRPRLVREGALPVERLEQVLGKLARPFAPS
jgi:L-threonylcarbamoyladenylate synthase